MQTIALRGPDVQLINTSSLGLKQVEPPYEIENHRLNLCPFVYNNQVDK